MMSLGNLGALYTKAGHPKKGEPLLQDAADRAQLILPPGHAIIGASLRKLGVCLTALGRHEQAEQALLDAYESHRSALGPEHARTLKVITNLVDLYDEWGKTEQATSWQAKLRP